MRTLAKALGMTTIACRAETAKRGRGFFNHKERREHREKAGNLNREICEIRDCLNGVRVN